MLETLPSHARATHREDGRASGGLSMASVRTTSAHKRVSGEGEIGEVLTSIRRGMGFVAVQPDGRGGEVREGAANIEPGPPVHGGRRERGRRGYGGAEEDAGVYG